MVMLNVVLDELHLGDRVRLIEDFLETRWRAVPADGWRNARTYRDWAEGLAMRAVVSGVGSSVRHTNPCIRSWAGLANQHGAASKNGE